jgi:hypothetical protein
MRDREEDPTTGLVKAFLGSLGFFAVSVLLWDGCPGPIVVSVVFGSAALLSLVFLVFPELRYDVRRERLFAELERSGALARVSPERVRVWSALSELFLDTDVSSEIEGIAATLTDSPYSERELWEILSDEVAPVVLPNLFDVAGVWMGFDEEWLTREILARGGSTLRRIPVVRESLRFLDTVLVRRDWEAVARRVRERRASR